MKKSTLTKLICLAILCIMVLPLVMACGQKFTVYFDANGGELKEGEDERKVKSGEMIGALPTPTKEGYKFMGWYEEEDTNQEDRIKKTTMVAFNMVLVAKWEFNDNLVSVEFDANGGEIAKDVVYIDKGTTLGNLLVDPTRADGATFEGWFDAKNNKVTKTTKISSPIVLKAKWIEPVLCSNGTYTHNWTIWDYEASEPTCTQDGKAVRLCQDCGHREEKVGTEKLGHDYATGWTFGQMQQSRLCDRCNREEVVKYTNLSTKIKETVITGSVYGPENVNCLYNDNWTETFGTTFAGKGGAVTVDVTFKEATEVDCVFIKGTGSNGYVLSVLYAGDTDYTVLTETGAFGDVAQRYAIDGTITNARIEMANSGDGGSYWQELAFADVPEIEE
ncbi:MAG: InlB B-repeat-containing protein [Clostridia bacterium]|nr:InlB B-repeat-containing protein [Clostridia bacterium]